jgi:hypothetical protein
MARTRCHGDHDAKPRDHRDGEAKQASRVADGGVRQVSNVTTRAPCRGNSNESMAYESGCGDAQPLNIVRLVASGWDQKELWAVAQIERNRPADSAYRANPENLNLKYRLIFLALAILLMEGRAIASQAIVSLRTRLYQLGKLRNHRSPWF